jgi:peroxiredoxin Q/BCP
MVKHVRCVTRYGVKGLRASLVLSAALACQERAQPPDKATPDHPAITYHAALPVSEAASSNPPAEPAAAPHVTFTLQDGFQLSLAALKGKFVAVYFCRAARSVACVGEAQALRAHWNELHEQRMVAIVGVTPEASAEQRAFITAQGLPFDLASDPEGKLARRFGLPGDGSYDVKAFLVGRDGRIQKSWSAANPTADTLDLLALASE